MIIVTGGAGFIGSYVAAELQAKGYKDIVIVDRLGSRRQMENIAKRELRAIVAPEETFSFLEEHKTEITAVIHMGAISTTTEKDADLIIRSNFQLSQKLWYFCCKNNVQYIYASSAATYGDGNMGFTDDESLDFLNSLRPLNPYGWSKALFDRFAAREIMEKRPVPKQYAGLKFFNVYGPNEYHKGGQKSVVAHIFPDVKNDREVKLFKSYNPAYQGRRTIKRFCLGRRYSQRYPVAVGKSAGKRAVQCRHRRSRSFYDLAKAVWAAMGKTPKIGFKEMPEELRGKYQYYTKADLTKLRKGRIYGSNDQP